ncbi:MAG: hypothetical protein M3022_05130 [Actinomycetota bacterium]|nr:hypothetical protein [Actinomycetota bacterium]
MFESKVKNAGMTTTRKFALTTFDAPTKIRWAERSKNVVTVREGGYDLEAVSESQTKVTIRNEFEGHGFGKRIVGFALSAVATPWRSRAPAADTQSWLGASPWLGSGRLTGTCRGVVAGAAECPTSSKPLRRATIATL